ncbi:MAG: YkgJ family cysteine cluster protein [Armatimonadota bacterium]|nr:MAG: YkgJ family cysteine cluster protein [Armatimonadota bacterium]
MRSSQDADPARMLRRARRARLFDSLARIYADFPETTCESCARCCFESPGIFLVEYLSLIHLVAQMPRQRREALLDRSFGELFFSWIEPHRQCIFLESSRCTIYQQRPLACRLFGLVAPQDRDRAEAQARLAARQEAERLRLFGIHIPEAVVQRSLAGCDRVRDTHGRPLSVDSDAVAARVARLDAALLPQEIVMQDFCFRSLPERLGAAALGAETIDGMRVQLLRRAQRGEPTRDLIALVLDQARLPTSLRQKKGRRR